MMTKRSCKKRRGQENERDGSTTSARVKMLIRGRRWRAPQTNVTNRLRILFSLAPILEFIGGKQPTSRLQKERRHQEGRT